MAGLRIATVSTVALVTVGVLVGHGGLGQLITGGFNANFYRAEIVTGTIGCVLLALVADVLLAGLERLLHPLDAGGAVVNAFSDAFLYLNDPFNWTKPNGILDLLWVHLADLRGGRPDRHGDRAADRDRARAPAGGAAARSSSSPT